VGYWLDAGFVGRGLVTRAVTAVLDHAFGPLGLDRVGLRTVIDNALSRNVAERLGFTQEGVLREYAAFPDERRDLVLYGLLAPEWRKANQRATADR
jgi:ribosomal-protein-serine acetyltransferase